MYDEWRQHNNSDAIFRVTCHVHTTVFFFFLLLSILSIPIYIRNARRTTYIQRINISSKYNNSCTVAFFLQSHILLVIDFRGENVVIKILADFIRPWHATNPYEVCMYACNFTVFHRINLPQYKYGVQVGNELLLIRFI